MKIIYQSENAYILEEGRYMLSNLPKPKAWEIFEANLDKERLSQLKKSTGYEYVAFEDLKKIVEYRKLNPYYSWGKYVELLTDGVMNSYILDDYRFPIDHFRKTLKNKKSWQKRFGETLISIWVTNNRRFYRYNRYQH